MSGRGLSSLMLACGCALVACQAISGLGSFGVEQKHGAGPVSGAGAGSSVASSVGVAQGGSPSATTEESNTVGTAETSSSSVMAATATVATAGAGGATASSSSSTGGGLGFGGAPNSGACDQWVYITTKTGSGNITNVKVADDECNLEAKDGPPVPVPTGDWRAVLSVAGKFGSAAFRIPAPGKVCLLNDGFSALPSNQIVADTGKWWTSVHQIAVDHDAKGGTVMAGGVWTGTNPDGTLAASNCKDFTSALMADPGVAGRNDFTDAKWVNNTPVPCNTALPVYCPSLPK